MSNRKKVEKYVLGLMSVVDKNDKNKPNFNRYRDMFEAMSDKKFDDWMKAIRDGSENLHIYSPNLNNELTSEVVDAMCKYTKTNLYEKIWFRDELTGRRYLSPIKYRILQISVRRLKQFLMDKIRIPESDRRRDLLSGQVVKPDKGSSFSLVEMQAVVDKGLEKSAIELAKVRAGDLPAYSELTSSIAANGEVSLDELDLGSSTPRSAIVLSTLLTGRHIGNNIVEEG